MLPAKIKASMPRLLGDILVRAKAISPRQLEDAISNQVVYGGRLGTNLMDLGYLTEGQLANFLSQQSGVPTIDPNAYVKIHKSIAKALPKAVAERTLSVPLVMKDKVLHVVMADPNNVAMQDEVRFAAGCKLQIYVAPEVRVYYLLNKLYGTKRDVRYVTLSRTDQMALRSSAGAPGPKVETGPPKPQKVLSISGLEDASQSGDLMSETEFSQLTQSVGITTPAPVFEADGALEDDVLLGDMDDDQSEVLLLDHEISDEEIVDLVAEEAAETATAQGANENKVADEALPVRQLTLDQATKALKHVEDRDQIARIVLGFAMSTFKRTALFLVRPDMVMGWDGTGQNLSREVVERLMIPLNVPSVFKLVYESRAHFIGAIPKSPVNSRFIKTLGGDQPRSAFVIPIVFKGKVVNILYGDNGPGTDASYDIAELLILAMKIPQSFEDLVRRTKNTTSQG
jgi:hypothetical protein